jgi:DNA-binding SARP family transcriptional activator/predicted ATPase
MKGGEQIYMNNLQIRLFGPLELSVGKTALAPLTVSPARSLFTYLAYHHDHPISRARLLGIFWAEHTETSARRALSHALWQLRQHAEALDQRLVTESDAVVFQFLAGDTLDVEAFETLCRLPSVSISPTEKLARLREAVSIYRADLLENVYADWVLLERERLRDHYLQALEALTTLQKRRGAYEDALDAARRLVATDPLRESAHRELMRLYHLLDRPRAALQQFQTLRTALAQELGTQPTFTTVSLCREIAASLEEGEAPYLPLGVAPPLLGNLAHLPFVGRREERRQLTQVLKAALQAHGGLVVVRGAAGVGKTRLVRELVADAEWRGFQVGLAKIAPLGAVPPYQLLREALASLLTPLRICQLAELVEERWLSALVPLFPSIREQLPDLPPLPPLDLQAEWQRLWEALARCLRTLASITPLLLVLEDVHWADNASLAALPHLAKHLADTPLLLVLTSRIVEAHERTLVLETLEAAGQNAPLTRITVPPFNSDEIDTLLYRALAVRAGDVTAGTFAERLAVTTGGNAFHLLESLKLLFEQGALTREAGGRWAFPEVDLSLEAPTSIRGLVEERVARFPAATREMLELAAVLGEDADFSVFAAAKIAPPKELPRHLERLTRRGFLRQTEAGYRFEHDLVRSGVYDGLAQPRRRALHRRAGEALESVCPGRIEALAYHWTRAEAWDQAADYHQQAGDRARAVYANAEAVEYYSQALAALERLSGPPDLARIYELRLGREAVYALQGARTAQVEDLAALEALAERLDSDQRRIEVALCQVCYQHAVGDHSAASEVAQQVIALARRVQDVGGEAAGHFQQGAGHWLQGDCKAARPELEQALTLTQAARTMAGSVPASVESLRQMEADSLRLLGNVCGYLNDYAEAIAFYERSLHICREIGDRQGEGKVLGNIGSIAYDQGDYAKSRTCLEQALAIVREIGDRQTEANTLTNLGYTAVEQGAYTRGSVYLEQARQIYREIGDWHGLGWLLNYIGQFAVCFGNYDEAAIICERALHICQEVGDHLGEAWGLANLSLYAHSQGKYEDAREYGQQAVQITEEIGERFHQAYALKNLGHVLGALGRLTDAADAYERALDLRRELGQSNLATEPLAGLARVALAQGDTAEAQSHIQGILSHLEGGTLKGTNEPFYVYLTCYRVLHAIGDPRAFEILETAHALLQEWAVDIDDEGLRRSFLRNVAAHQELLDAYHAWQILQQGHRRTVRLPRAGVPTGRPLTDVEIIEVAWTVAVSEDEEVGGKVARRRHRIRRLLREASEQGAEATVDDLAAALDVSARTIKRDLAALRAAGHQITTRGSRAS